MPETSLSVFRGWSYFVFVQLISFAAFLVGIILLIPLCAFRLWKVRESKEYPGRQIEEFPAIFYPWNNEEDGVIGAYFYRQKHPNERVCAYLWSAWRNSANNLRFVFRWVGGPFKRWTFGRWYVQLGWYPNGFPVLSAGSIEPELPNV